MNSAILLAVIDYREKDRYWAHAFGIVRFGALLVWAGPRNSGFGRILEMCSKMQQVWDCRSDRASAGPVGDLRGR
jgi:hypothetical protein